MSLILFFCIPAHGHTNPTLALVRELVHRGHQVRYYSFEPFRPQIEQTGATYISCDSFLPPAPARKSRIGKDFSALLEMTAEVTLQMGEHILPLLEQERPDCIVTDSLCIWGKLFAMRLSIPFICSTTSFAFNQYTARLMKQGLLEIAYLLIGWPKIQRKLRELKNAGYPASDFLSLIQNDEHTPTIVYTSRSFQPMADTFSNLYSFVGSSFLMPVSGTAEDFPFSERLKNRRLVYISLGTVNNRNRKFFQNCIQAFKDCDLDVLISAGGSDLSLDLQKLPDHIAVRPFVPQLSVLQKADVFLTHCGMNSVSESLYFSVPMVLFPQQSEQEAVAGRVLELGAGVRLSGIRPEQIRSAVYQVLENSSFRARARKLSDDFHAAGGFRAAADAVERLLPSRIP